MLLPVEHPWALVVLPLSLLPWLKATRASQPHAWIALLPADSLADRLGLALRVIASAAIASCVLGIAQPAWNSPPTEHVGRGAEIIFLLDRSLSMDQSFGARSSTNGRTGVDAVSGGESKGAAARRLLAEFARRRTHDLMAMEEFTTTPIRVIGFTHKQSAIQAAIAAGNIGHGVADTDVGRGLVAALGMFREQPYNGSRVILLVSDGGAQLSEAVQERITDLMQRERVALYWLYLRTTHGAGLLADRDVAAADNEIVPEHFLHQYFLHMGAPYHAYEADNPEALATAIADVDRLQSQPIRYAFPGAHRDLTPWAYAFALTCALLLGLANFWEVRSS